MIVAKLLFILHLPPPVHGAAMVGKYIRDSELINSEYDCRYINLTTAYSLEDIGRMSIKKLIAFAHLLKLIWYEVRVVKPDMVYVTPNAMGGPFYKDFIVVELLKLMGCKVVVHYHNKGVASRQDKWLDDKLYRIFYRKLKVILLSESLYSDVCKYVERKDVFFCPNGISNNNSSNNIKTVGANKQTRLLFLSNLIESKGVFVLLDALQILNKKNVSFLCDIVGGETKEIDTKRFQDEVVKRGLSKVVFYHGKKYGDEKQMFLQNADVFVFPTFYDNECFPLVLLEAMRQGLPCVTTDEGGIADIVKYGVNGLICEKRNAQSLADKLLYLIQNESIREEMGRKGYERYMQLFTLDEFEKRLSMILHECCETNQKRKC